MPSDPSRPQRFGQLIDPVRQGRIGKRFSFEGQRRLLRTKFCLPGNDPAEPHVDVIVRWHRPASPSSHSDNGAMRDYRTDHEEKCAIS